MKVLLIRVFILLCLIIFYVANISIISHKYEYSENVENLFRKVKFWAKNADYKLNYFGTTDEKTVNGKNSLKMDITVMGNGEKECFYYWVIPVRIKHYGEVIQSAHIWADSNASKYVSVGLNFVYPPDSVKSKTILQANRWLKISDTLSQPSNNSGFISSVSGYEDGYSEGKELNRIGIFIRAKGQHRLVFYLNDIVLTGKTFNISDFQKYLKERWELLKIRYNQVLSSFAEYENNNFIKAREIQSVQAGINTTFLIDNSIKYKDELSKIYNKIEKTGRIKVPEIDKFSSLMTSLNGNIEMINSGISNPASKAVAFYLPATRYNRLTGTNIPSEVKPVQKVSLRVCPDQYESFSILLQPKEKLSDVEVKWSELKGSGKTIDQTALDVYIAKVWYQAGVKSTEVNKKVLTQELLLKDDDLVQVDHKSQTNYLKVSDRSGNERYIDISTPDSKFPDDVIIKDSKSLKPFSADPENNKQLWFTFHVPMDAKPGKYNTAIRLQSAGRQILEFPLEIQVLPFKLDESRLTYSLYYHGALRDWKLRAFHCEDKTEEQLEAELLDMKQHGVLYSTNYQDIKHIERNLKIRNKVGLPNDKLFSTLLDWCTGLPKSEKELLEFKSRVQKFKSSAEKMGYKQLYIYGIDEARGERLIAQRPAWKAAHELGVKIFVAGYYETFSDVGDLLDIGIVQGPLSKEQSALYHSAGNQVFSYSNPQVGQENPEIYRRNFGLALWKAGYDGSMDYAYQKNYGSIWNDFDNPRYREETFTYPTSDGLISTVQWEGFRQGVNDVRFLSTLLNRIDKLKASGKNTSDLEKWVKSIDPSDDLDMLRNIIIDKILSLSSS